MKKLLKSCFVVCTLLIILFNFTGCYDAHGIEELAYAVAVGLDITDSNELELTLQFAKNGSSSSEESVGSSQSEGSIISSVVCSSIDSGIALINSHISKKINLSHCQEIIFSEKIATIGISEYLDTFANNVEIRTDCAIVISKANAKDYLKNVKPSLETLTARYYESTLTTYEYTGYTANIKLAEFYSAVKDDYSEAYAILGGINSKHYTNTAKINADYTAGENPVSDSDVIETLGIAVFSGDKLVGELTGLDSICHLIINNDLDQCTLSVPNPFENNRYIDLLITSTKNTKCSVNIINNSPLVNINVHLIGYGLSLDSKTYYNTEESLNKIQKYAQKYIQRKLENYLYNTSLKYNSDISGFGRYAVKNYLTLDEWHNANWLGNYKNCFFNVNVEFTLKSGSLFGES